uniref:Armadillo repeat containing 12 n=1 Tax=Rousettus aegyptiacus TaxID=9407 RepID=A0A7J8K4Y6_ROUAE|nr:armadillo repeat containing 12 [Rousettus aegyptiacus]
MSRAGGRAGNENSLTQQLGVAGHTAAGYMSHFLQTSPLWKASEGYNSLFQTEASACTTDDIMLVGSMLDDKDNSVRIQALNTLKAFSGIRKFRLKIQEHSIKVLELISTIWDSELHIASLRLLNNLPLPDFAHPQLRRVMPALMEILQSNYILAQVQAIRLLSSLAQKNDLLYDILNCQVRKELKRS